MAGHAETNFARSVVGTALASAGYTDRYIEFGWSCANHTALRQNATGAMPLTIDVASFVTSRRRDWKSSAVACKLDHFSHMGGNNASLSVVRELYEATAAPAILLANSENAELWADCWKVKPKMLESIPFNAASLATAFARHRPQVGREELGRIRGGQGFLFDRLHDARRDQLAGFLHRGLDKATATLIPAFGKLVEREKSVAMRSLSHLAMALLAARIFEDKAFLGREREQTVDARAILHAAERRSNGFFRHVVHDDLKRLDHLVGAEVIDDALPQIMAHLTGPVCFSMITPDMLGDLYEQALVRNGKRGGDVRMEGIHYTSLALARHVLQRIPLETLPPHMRVVADMACGSGSFLLAATERLRSVFDANESDSEGEVLKHLASRVIGNDLDRIALLVTKLRYLLSHWIEFQTPDDAPIPSSLLSHDALTLTRKKLGPASPTVVVGNPPFHADRGEQLATRFLLKAIELLPEGGYVGMVMPAEFLRQRRYKAPEARRVLLESCELLEVWEMPQGTVGLSARQVPCVLIARKRERRATSQKKEVVVFKSSYSPRTKAVEEIREQLRFSWTFLASGPPGANKTSWAQDDEADSKYKLVASPLDQIWAAISFEYTVAAVCGDQVCKGINAKGKGAAFSVVPRQGYEPFFQHQGRLRPYAVEKSDWLDDPEAKGPYVDPTTVVAKQLERWPLYRGSKVILSARTNRNSSTQTVAAVDTTGSFPGDDFWCLAPRTDGVISTLRHDAGTASRMVILKWLAALLNSPVGQAWVAIHSTARGVLQDAVTSLPVPPFIDREICLWVDKYTDAAKRTGRRKAPAWAAGRELSAENQSDSKSQIAAANINRLVLNSYGISDSQAIGIYRFLESMTDPWAAEGNEQQGLDAPVRRISGRVIDVDAHRQTVTLWLPRYSASPGGITVPLPRDMPGWAVRPGTNFTCLAPRDVNADDPTGNPWALRSFRPDPYAYMSDAEVAASFGDEKKGG